MADPNDWRRHPAPFGDLAGIFVHKFKINKQDILLAYQLHPTKFQPVSVLLLSLGSHENFYSELRRLN